MKITKYIGLGLALLFPFTSFAYSVTIDPIQTSGCGAQAVTVTGTVNYNDPDGINPPAKVVVSQSGNVVYQSANLSPKWSASVKLPEGRSTVDVHLTTTDPVYTNTTSVRAAASAFANVQTCEQNSTAVITPVVTTPNSVPAQAQNNNIDKKFVRQLLIMIENGQLKALLQKLLNQ